MRIAETLNEGLKREYSVSIPAADIEAKVDAQLGKVASQVRMPGFRPGKVPLNLVRKMHGAQLRSDALQEAVNEGMQQLIAEHALRPAMQPQIDLAAPPAEGQDVDFTVAVEVLPVIDAPKIDGIALEKLVVEPGDAELDAAVQRLADQQKSFEPAPADHAAATGDTVVVDFAGSVDGEPFDGGKGEGMKILIGSGQLIPGFEDQLIGAKTGEARTVKVTFPTDYNVAYLTGRDAEFAVTVTGVEVAAPVALDDAFAKGFGIDSYEALREILKDQVTAELGAMTRTHMKRKLLDTLASAHDFAVPQSMVDAEFDQIWRQVEAEGEDSGDDAKKADDRAEYRRIAERRVRLGLLLSEIGQGNGVNVTQAEMNRLIGQEATKYDRAEQPQVVKYFQENAMAAAQLRAPLYEDKVVDFLIGKADVTERVVSREALQAEIESDDETPGAHVHGPDCGHDHGHDHAGHDHGHDHAGHDHAPAPKAKKAKAKPAAAEPVTAEAEAAPAVAEADPAAAEAPAKAAKPKKAKPVETDPVAAIEPQAAVEPGAEPAAAAKPKRAKKTAAE
ncbi:trigger factor [Glacieibacterium megasporae]|uniref:trigger factor n=1 Tax=Glacieibacterium megasporae TaxID=2835787 RepID=UPI001C1DD092|nr:trigger factor [Polymorphobacter megasporae]UAJ09567.1 trigger factor [Polymorphobacter megasporae]